MLKGFLCLKDIKSVWLPNVFPEIHIHSSVYFMITNTVSALHLWQIEAVNDVQWCMCYLCWFSRGPVFPHPRGNLHWLHRGRNLVDCCFLGLCSLTREYKVSRDMSQYCTCKNIQYITFNCVTCTWLIRVHESQSEFWSGTPWSLVAFYLPIDLKKGSASLVGPWYTTSPIESIIRPSNRRYME